MQSLNAAEFVINLSRWNNFRSVLFVLNGVFSLLVFFVMIRVKMARENMEPLVWKQSALKTVVDAIQFCIGVLGVCSPGGCGWWFVQGVGSTEPQPTTFQRAESVSVVGPVGLDRICRARRGSSQILRPS